MGSIVSFESDSSFTLRVRGSKGRKASVALADNALIWRDEDCALHDFAQGDEVVAEGAWSCERYVASALVPMTTLFEARILGVEPQGLAT